MIENTAVEGSRGRAARAAAARQPLWVRLRLHRLLDFSPLRCRSDREKSNAAERDVRPSVLALLPPVLARSR